MKAVKDPFQLSALIADKTGAAALRIFKVFADDSGSGWGRASLIASVEQPAIHLALPVWPTQLAADGPRVPNTHIAWVKRHVRTASAALFWDAANYQLGGGSEFYQAISAFERRHTLEVNITWSGAATSCALKFEVADDATTDQAALMTVIAQLQLVATHLSELAYAHESHVHRPNPLSPREMDVLRHSLDGRSVWDLSQIMKLDESRVCGLLKAACSSLDSPWRHQSAARALHRGWLD